MTTEKYADEIETVLLSEEQIRERIADMAVAVGKRYENVEKEVVLIAVLKGAAIFVSDFARALPIPSEMEFMAVSSYGSSTSSSGVVRILKDLDRDITDRDVLIVEDIVDTGHSMDLLYRQFQARGARSLRLAVLVDKNDRREVPVTSHFVGFTLPSGFVVGYGLDYAESYRELPAIYEAEIEE